MIFDKSSYITLHYGYNKLSILDASFINSGGKLKINNIIDETQPHLTLLEPVKDVKGFKITLPRLYPLICSADTRIVTVLGAVKATDLCLKCVISTGVGSARPLSIEPIVFDGFKLDFDVDDALVLINGIYVII